MLRRKLLLTLGSLVLLLVAVTAVAVWLLERVRDDMDHVVNHGCALTKNVGELSRIITAIEVDLYELEAGHERHLDNLISGVESLNQLVARLQENYVIRSEEGAVPYSRIQAVLPEFEGHIGALATTLDAGLAAFHTREALNNSMTIRREALALANVACHRVEGEREALLSRFRWLVLGLAIIFLLVIDIAVMVLWRTASMIVRPVERLIEASRELAKEHFDTRVRLEQKDEFDELGQAYNHLAEQLQDHEQRKVELLGQMARTLNHELNNATAIIELQLTLLQDNLDDREGTAKCLRLIRQNLERMTHTVQLLKNVQRVVLIDYRDGEKMLDLERSAQAQMPEPGSARNVKP